MELFSAGPPAVPIPKNHRATKANSGSSDTRGLAFLAFPLEEKISANIHRTARLVVYFYFFQKDKRKTEVGLKGSIVFLFPAVVFLFLGREAPFSGTK